jgi:hypothetical protein
MARRFALGILLAGALLVPTSASAATFTNPDPIALPDNTVANPYPSNIPVSGLQGTVVRVRVTLVRILAAARDIDVLLVGPSGSTILTSDVCSGSDFANDTLTFDDAATSPLGASLCGNIADGAYKPSNYDPADTFPSAPPGPYPIGLSNFSGGQPNGVWKLFAVDDQAPDFGAINGGWILDVTTTGAVKKKKCKKRKKSAAAAKKKKRCKKRKRKSAS